MESLIAVFVVVVIVVVAYFHQKKLRRQSLGQTQPPTIAIFHPWCGDGGGGERVLWCMLDTLLSQLNSNPLKVYIYTDGKLDKSRLLGQVKHQFGIHLNPDHINLIAVSCCGYLNPNCYPLFTLMLQNLASVLVAINAAYHFEPDIYVDTTGFPFMYPIFKLFCFSKIVAYVHYPIITTDMVEVVRSRKSSFNNNELIARVSLFTKLKLIYYHVFSWVYYCCGQFTDVVMVNGTWTRTHIEKLWRCNATQLHTVYPPCGLEHTSGVGGGSSLSPSGDTVRKPVIISLGQFRPEKDHKSQLFIFKKIIDSLKDEQITNSLELHMIGSCRNEADQRLRDSLAQKAVNLGIEKNVKFLSSLSSDQLKKQLTTSLIGIHTMRDEHFGISVVEMAAAGVIVVAHKSGGPLLDILNTDMSIESGQVGSSTGFLAESINEYVLHIGTILSMTPDELKHIRKNARSKMKTHFSDSVFRKNVANIFERLLM